MNTFIDNYGVTYSEDRKVLLKGNSELEHYTIPEGTEVIGNDSWGKMNKIQEITIPEGVHTIEPLAFSGCMGLTGIRLPSTIKEIGSYAFEFTMLRSIAIPEGITVLHNDVFGECFGLGAVVLPSTLETIEEYAFCSCPSAQLILLANERKLRNIDSQAFDGSKAIFLVPYDLQKEYADAFPLHNMRFFGMKIHKNAGKADVYSPAGEIVGEIPVEQV